MSEAELARASTEAREAARLEGWIDAVEDAWDRLGVRRHQRRLLAAELQADVEASRDAGASLDVLLVDDVADFARALAEANQALPTDRTAPPDLSDLILTVLSGGLVGALLSWFVAIPALETALTHASDPIAAVIIYALCAVLTIALALSAVLWRFRDGPSIDKRALTSVAVGFAIGGIVGLVPASLFAASTAYSGSGIVMLIEVGIVAAFCAAGIALGWRTRSRQNCLA